MDIVVKGRKVDVSDKFRTHASEKLGKVERFGQRIMRLEVEVSEERNPRQADIRQRVEVTCFSKGPVIRAEAAAPDPFAALERVLDKLEERLRRAADKRRPHHRKTGPVGAAVPSPNGSGPAGGSTADTAAGSDDDAYAEERAPFVVREKVFEAPPMTLDEALFQMELVGHDFFLFADSDTGLPSVVYRRKGYDYGVLRLKQVDLQQAEDMTGT